MTDNSEPAREAVACLYTVQGDSQPFMRISRGMLHVAGDIVAVQPLGPLPATPAPGELDAVREIEAIFRRHLQANDYAKDLIKRIAFDVVPAVRKALSAALAPSTSAATRGEPVAWVQPGYLSMLQKYGSCSMRAEPIEAMDYIVPVYGAPPAPAAESAQVKEARRVRHKKRGTTYEVLGEAQVQISGECLAVEDGPMQSAALLREGDNLVFYRCEQTGKLWCRLPDEFEDGRFEDIRASLATDAKE